MIRQLTDGPHINHPTYFLQSSFFPGDRELFFTSYRTGDAFVGMFELQLSPQLRLGYAYDYTISKLNTYNTKGTHELMLRYEFKSKKNQRIISPRYY